MTLINNAQNNSKIPDPQNSESADSTNNSGVDQAALEAYVQAIQKERGTNERITYKGKVLYTPKNGRPTAEFRIEPGISRTPKPTNTDCTESTSSSGTGSVNKLFEFLKQFVELLGNFFKEDKPKPWNPWNPFMRGQQTNNANYYGIGGTGNVNFPNYTSNPITDYNQGHQGCYSGTGSMDKFFDFLKQFIETMENFFKGGNPESCNPSTPPPAPDFPVCVDIDLNKDGKHDFTIRHNKLYTIFQGKDGFEHIGDEIKSIPGVDLNKLAKDIKSLNHTSDPTGNRLEFDTDLNNDGTLDHIYTWDPPESEPTPPAPSTPHKAAKPRRHRPAPQKKPGFTLKSLWDKTIGKALRHIF